MRKIKIFQIFGIFLFYVLCISSYADAALPSGSTEDNDAVIAYHDDLLIQDMMTMSSALKVIPLMGPILDSVFSRLLHYIVMFEYTTNNLLDKILRDSLPCTITETSFKCNGIYANGGLSTILRRAIDEMPDTVPLFIIKKILDPMMILWAFFFTGFFD